MEIKFPKSLEGRQHFVKYLYEQNLSAKIMCLRLGCSPDVLHRALVHLGLREGKNRQKNV